MKLKLKLTLSLIGSFLFFSVSFIDTMILIPIFALLLLALYFLYTRGRGHTPTGLFAILINLAMGGFVAFVLALAIAFNTGIYSGTLTPMVWFFGICLLLSLVGLILSLVWGTTHKFGEKD